MTEVERLLVRELARALAGIPSAQFAGVTEIPGPIAYTRAFRDAVARTLMAGVPRAITRALGLRRIHVAIDEATRVVTTSDPTFWRPLRFRFTRTGIDAVWSALRWRGRAADYGTPWDSLLLATLDETHARALGAAATTDASWPAAALGLLTLTRRAGATDMPWADAFASPETTPLPLRFLLVEETASYYARTVAVVERAYEDALRPASASGMRAWLGRSRPPGESHMHRPRVRRPGASGEEVSPAPPAWPRFDPRHDAYFEWREGAAAGYALDAVERALRVWTAPPGLTYDDTDLLEAAVHTTHLRTHRTRLAAAIDRAGRTL